MSLIAPASSEISVTAQENSSKHKSVLSFLETLGKDIGIGIQAAGPVVTVLDPPVGRIVTAVGTFLHTILNDATTPVPSPGDLSKVTQAIATTHTLAAASQQQVLPAPSPGTSIAIPVSGTLNFSQPSA